MIISKFCNYMLIHCIAGNAGKKNHQDVRIINDHTGETKTGKLLVNWSEKGRPRYMRTACSILSKLSHPEHHLCRLLLSGRQSRTRKVYTMRLK